MGMVGVLYGYIVRNLRKPKKDFCLSIGLVGSIVWFLYEWMCSFGNIIQCYNSNNLLYTGARLITEVVGTSKRIIDDSLFQARRS